MKRLVGLAGLVARQILGRFPKAGAGVHRTKVMAVGLCFACMFVEGATWVYEEGAKSSAAVWDTTGTLSNVVNNYAFDVKLLTGDAGIIDPATAGDAAPVRIEGFRVDAMSNVGTGNLDFTDVKTDVGYGVISFGKGCYQMMNSVEGCTEFIAPDAMAFTWGLFYYNGALEKIVISDKVTEFPGNLFARTTKLKDLEPKEFPYITELWAQGDFMNAEALAIDLSFPNVTNVSAQKVFSDSGITFISMPKVEYFADNTFSSCANMTGDLHFAELKYIGESVFYNGWGSQSKITSCVAPKVSYVGPRAFNLCKSLTNAEFSAVCATNYGNSAFYECRALERLEPMPKFRNMTDETLRNPVCRCGAVGSIELTGGEGLTTIPENWLATCGGVTSLTIKATANLTTVSGWACNLAGGAVVYWNVPKAPTSLGSSVFNSTDTGNRSRIVVTSDIEGWTTNYPNYFQSITDEDRGRADYPGEKTFGKLYSNWDSIVYLVKGPAPVFCIRIR